MVNTWSWKKFERWEMACKCGCGFDTMDAELLVVLLDLKKAFNNPLININSGCRCREHNEKVQRGSNPDYLPYSSRSQHMLGRAADITVVGHSSHEVYGYLVGQYQDRFGIGRYSNFVHIDTRTGRPWRKP